MNQKSSKGKARIDSSADLPCSAQGSCGVHGAERAKEGEVGEGQSVRLPKVLSFLVLLSWGSSGAFRSGALRKKRRAATLA